MLIFSQTPLHLSVLTRQPRVTRALLMAGASLEAPDRNGNTALHLACLNNFMDCAGALTHRVSVAEYREFLGDKKPLLLPQTPQSLEVKNYEGKLILLHSLDKLAFGLYLGLCIIR